MYIRTWMKRTSPRRILSLFIQSIDHLLLESTRHAVNQELRRLRYLLPDVEMGMKSARKLDEMDSPFTHISDVRKGGLLRLLKLASIYCYIYISSSCCDLSSCRQCNPKIWIIITDTGRDSAFILGVSPSRTPLRPQGDTMVKLRYFCIYWGLVYSPSDPVYPTELIRGSSRQCHQYPPRFVRGSR